MTNLDIGAWVAVGVLLIIAAGLHLRDWRRGWDKSVRRLDRPEQPINFTGNRRI